jgi:hypothetical protein
LKPSTKTGGRSGVIDLGCIVNLAALALLSASTCAMAAGGDVPKGHPLREVLPDRVVPVRCDLALSPAAEAGKPFLSATASIRQDQRFAANVLPDIDHWIAARQSTHWGAQAVTVVPSGTQ